MIKYVSHSPSTVLYGLPELDEFRKGRWLLCRDKFCLVDIFNAVLPVDIFNAADIFNAVLPAREISDYSQLRSEVSTGQG